MKCRLALLILASAFCAVLAVPIPTKFEVFAAGVPQAQASFAPHLAVANAAGDAYEAARRAKRDHDDDDGYVVPQTSGVSPIPFWDQAFLYLGGQSRFVQSAGVDPITGVGSPNIALPFVPLIGATRPPTKQFILKDPIAGQYTGPARFSDGNTYNRYFIWFPVGFNVTSGFPIFGCFQQPTGWDYEAAQHRTSYLNNVSVSIDVAIPEGRSGRYRTIAVPSYFYNGFTKESGGTPSFLSYSGFFDKSNLRAYQLNFSQGQGGLKTPGVTCTPRPAIVSGEYNWNGPGVRVLPGSAITDDVFQMDNSCYRGGNPANGVEQFLPNFSDVFDFS
jgi:hypothetical protein